MGPVVVDSLVVVRSVLADGGDLMGTMYRHVARTGTFRSERHAGMGPRRAEHQRGDHDQKNAHRGNHSCTLSD